MHPYLILPFASGILCIALSIATLVRNVSPGPQGAMRRLRWLMWVGGAWALCEVLWNLVPDGGATQTFLVRTWCVAFVLLGPIAIDLPGRIHGQPTSLQIRRQRALYAVAGVLIAITCSTPLVVSGLEATSWGLGLVPGPLYPVASAFTIALSFGALLRMRSVIEATASQDSTPTRRRLLAGIAAPIVAGFITDAVLPIAGIQVPRLATAGFGIFALAVILLLKPRRDRLIGSPEQFAYEILGTLSDGVALVTLDDQILTANDRLAELLEVEPGSLFAQPLQCHLPKLDLTRAHQLRDHESVLRIDEEREIAVSVSLCPLFDDRDRAMGLVVVVRDDREVERLRSHMALSARLAAVGQLAAGIAHEINNPLAFTRANLAVLQEHWEDLKKELPPSQRSEKVEYILDEGDDILSESLEGIDRAAAIVRDVREFSHSGERKHSPTDVNELLDRIIRVAAPEIGRNIELVREYGDLPLISASAQQLKQVFLNLLLNAIHAVEDDGEVRLETRVEGDEVIVRICDDGPGIPTEDAERIFDPFYTTKPVGKGTGLGLSISYEIVRSHGGTLSVAPGVGPGACLQVRLPISGNTEEE